jgi:hypothetical protein
MADWRWRSVTRSVAEIGETRIAAEKMSKGAFQGDWGSPLEVWMRRFDREER